MRKGRTQMASFHYRIKSGKKGTAADHSSYIMREGKYRDREDVLWTGSGNLPEWAKDDPKQFWKMADRYERANGAAYREHEVALPSELNEVQLHALVDKLVRALAGDKPHQYAIHAPVAALAGVRQPHMHLVASDRVPDGLTRPAEQMFRRFNPKAPNRGGCRKDSGGRLPLEVRDELIARRKMIAELQNEALADSGHDTRVDHRSHKERGIESQPERHLGPARIKHMTVEDKTKYLAGRAGAEKGGKA